MKCRILIISVLGLALGLPASALAAPTDSDTSDKPSWRRMLDGFYARAGLLYIAPLGRSEEVELSEAEGPARLAINNGPIEGSYVELGSTFMPAMIVGYRLPFLDRQLSIETILGLPFKLRLIAGGTLAERSLAPVALGNVPTGIPALGSELGEVTVLPPVLTAVYRFLPSLPVHPYVGVGVSLMIPLSAEITNPILTEVTSPRVEISPRVGWVLQAGVEVNIYASWFVFADFKFLGGLSLEARVEEIWVRTPDLPLYESVRVGNNAVRLTADPTVWMLGMGFEF